MVAEARGNGPVAHLRVQPAKVLLVLLSVVAVMLAISLPLQFLTHQTDVDVPERVLKAFDFDQENNLPTWFATVLLLTCSTVLFLIFRAYLVERDPQAKWWGGLSLAFLYLSIDEASSLHEATVERMQQLIDATGALYAAWVVPVGIVVAIFGLIYLRFLLSLPRWMQGLLALSAVLFVGGAMGVEMLAWHYRYPIHAATPTDWEGTKDITWAMLSHLEEVMEMVGVSVFLFALLHYFGERQISAVVTVVSVAADEGRARPAGVSPGARRADGNTPGLVPGPQRHEEIAAE
jgi:hypothetical protein